jgi:hypothetical protein
MIKNLLDREKMKKVIIRSGNSSALALEIVDLRMRIMNILFRIQKCSQARKERKVLLLLKPCPVKRKISKKIGDYCLNIYHIHDNFWMTN